MLTSLDPKFLQAMKFRCIGPPRGGRVLAVAGHPTDIATFYFGACAGGIWKSDDAGTYWENISDGQLGSSAIGALAVAPSDPNVIYAGTGEATIRGDVSWGDGLYRSTDGGRTWSNMGLADTHHIAKIRVHPQNPELVYVAALGHAFGPNEERGVFRSKDGGGHWEKVLFVNDKAGAVDLAMDPTNPRILYAAIYETYRHFWTLNSGGPASGLWKSTDGGDTWDEITAHPGLPGGIKGKIGVTMSPAKPSRVWAIIEAENDKAGLYRSDDHGAKWELVSNNRELIHRPWYYCHVFADPQDEETVYILNLKMWKSTDGGKQWTEITTPHGDNHDLWIDPANPRRMVQGNDGGACVSLTGGASWSTIYNQCTAQFYHVAVDSQYPYRVYGTQQDNSSISVPSATEKGAIPWGDCYAAGTGESGYIAVHPEDDNIVYVGAVGSSPGGGGALQRYDHRTKQVQLITVWPEMYTGWGAGDLKYRFAWTFPIVFSPHDANVLYATGNHVFRTTNEGVSWEAISPDLSRQDPAKLVASGGPLTLDTSGAEHYGTVYAFLESSHQAGLFWAGTDDGWVHVSRDGGATWQNVTPPDLPEWSLISMIEESPYAAGTVYVAATHYKLDDYRPLLYKTSDYGVTWQSLNGDLPETTVTRVIRVDPVQPGLLYVGTERGIMVSLDDGLHWSPFADNLPVVPVYDMVIKESDLVVGTHGRSFWIMDDLTPLRAYAAGLAVDEPQLIPPRTTVRSWEGWSVGAWRGPGKNYMLGLGFTSTFSEAKDETGEVHRIIWDGGQNPDNGAVIYYLLPAGETPDDLSLSILDASGSVVRTFGRKTDATPAGERTLSAQPGLNRFVWDLRYPNATVAPSDITTAKSELGPRGAPGRYRVQLTADGTVHEAEFELVKDPRVSATQSDLDAQFGLWTEIRDKVSQAHTAINQIHSVRTQLGEWQRRAIDLPGADQVDAAVDALGEKLTAIETELAQQGAMTANDRLRIKARLNAKLITLASVVAAADMRPTDQTYAVYEQLSTQVDAQIDALHAVLETDLRALTDLLGELTIPAIRP